MRSSSNPRDSRQPGFPRQLLNVALDVTGPINGLEFGGRALLWVGLFVYGLGYIFSPIDRPQESTSLVDTVIGMANLVFHEAGHIILSPLGELMAALGGSLFQVLIPGVCLMAFLTMHPNPFGASVMLWWVGQNLIDLAPYIADARAQQLILLGGVTGRDVPGYHDWNNVLGRLGLLELDRTLARLAHFSGAALITLALAWGAYVLLLQYRELRR